MSHDFKCDVCQKTFESSETLKVHIDSIIGSNLKSHIRIFCVKKDLKCDKGRKTFEYSETLI